MRFNRFTFLLMVSSVSCALAYSPAENPLMTVWGEKMTPETAWREYPRPHLVRKNWQNLNGLWEYAVNPRDQDRPAQWQGKILVPFCVESALSGVKRLLTAEEQIWYRRSFTASFNPKTERMLLHFGAVDFRTQVFINGVEATDVPHESGNLPFSLDVTDFVRQGENELVLSVWDPTNEKGAIQSLGKQHIKPHGCFYTRVSGIWQTVWTEIVPATYLTGYQVVTDIDAGTAAITVQAEGNLSDAEVKVQVSAPGARSIVAEGEIEGWGKPVVLKIKNPKLWSPEHPNLYDLTITLEADGSEDDVVKGYFGMRKIEFRPDEKGINRFYLNNRKIFMQGTLDQGWWPDGLLTPPSEEAMAWDIRLLKSVGFNMMRKHIKIEPLRYYYLCDKLGLLVWQDMVSGWGGTEDRYTLYRSELKEMLDLLQTFPSIVMWVPYNEAWGQPKAAKTNQTLRWVKRYDPTRLVDGPSGWTDYGVGDTRDMHRYPGPGMFPVMKDRVSVLGEFGGIGLAVPDHLWQKKSWGYVSYKTAEDAFKRYADLIGTLREFASEGLAASVYTQTTDVEGEINGLATYDRKHVKFPVGPMAALHQSVYKAASETRIPVYRAILPTSESQPGEWSYTEAQPEKAWKEPSFEDKAWKRGTAGFGNAAIKRDYPQSPVRTRWESSRLWLRRSFAFSGDPATVRKLAIRAFYDEDAVVYLNGVQIAELKGYNTHYQDCKTLPGAEKALKKGSNVLAIEVRNKQGGAFIDVGLSTVEFR